MGFNSGFKGLRTFILLIWNNLLFSVYGDKCWLIHYTIMYTQKMDLEKEQYVKFPNCIH